MFVCYVFIVLRAAVSAAPVAQISTKDPNIRLANIVCTCYSDLTQLRGLQTALQRKQLKKNRLVTVKTERYAGESILTLHGYDCR
jgi:hypothetical protein